MANAFQNYLQGQQAAMQQGSNALAMQQAVQKIEKDRQLRDILSGAYQQPQAAIPAMGAAPAMGAVQPGAESLPAYPAQAAVPAQAGGVDIQNALGQMYAGGFGPEAMAFEQKQRTLGGATPSDVQTWEYLKKQFPDMPVTFESFLTSKRAGKVADIAGVPTQLPQAPGGAAVPLSTQKAELGYTGKKAEETKKAQIKAEAIAKAQTSLPKAQMQYEQTKGMVSNILQHPGLESSFGKMGMIPAIPGTDKANFQSMLAQLKDTTFINNRETLKGGGAITDFEGTKAENAALRAGRAQSAKEFKSAMKDYDYWVERGFDALKKAAKGDFSVKEAVPKKIGRFKIEVE